MLAKKLLITPLLILMSAVSLNCALLRHASGQTPQAQSQSPVTNAQRQAHPVSLAHLYWHFLIYQNHLDTKAAEATSNGKDGSGLRKMMQQGLGFSNADYAPIRISSVRLTAEVKALDVRAAAIRVDGPSAANQKAMMALSAERDTNISSEISYLKQALTPDQIRSFETFLVKLFSPLNAASRLPKPNGHAAASGVQQ